MYAMSLQRWLDKHTHVVAQRSQLIKDGVSSLTRDMWKTLQTPNWLLKSLHQSKQPHSGYILLVKANRMARGNFNSIFNQENL